MDSKSVADYARRIQMSPGWQHIGGKYAMSWTAIFFTMGFTFFALISTPVTQRSEFIWVFIPAGVLVAAITGLLLFSSRIWLPVCDRPHRPFIALGVYTTLTLANVLLHDLINARLGPFTTGVVTIDSAAQGVPGALISVFFPVIFVVILVTALVSYQEERAEQIELVRNLSIRQQQLEALRDSYESRIAQIHDELGYAVRRSIDPVIKEIDDRLERFEAGDGSLQEAQRSIMDAIDGIVRPISKELVEPDHRAFIDYEFPSAQAIPSAGKQRADVRTLITPARSSFVLTIWIGVGLLATSATSVHYPVRLLACFAATPFLVAFARYFPARWATMRRPVAIVVAASALIVWVYLGRLIYELAVIALPITPIANLSIVRPLMLTVPAALILTSTNASRTGRQQLVDKLHEVNDDLEFLIARLRIAEWAERRNLSLQLHGPLQSSLLSAAMLLSQPGIRSEDVGPVRRALSETASRIDEAPQSDTTLNEVLLGMAQTWRHSCVIALDVSKASEEYFNARPTKLMYITEIVREAISNAIRHGGATAMTFRLEEPQGRLIEMEIRDNGHGFNDSAEPGLGSALLDETTVSWSLTRDGEETKLLVFIPFFQESDVDEPYSALQST